MRAKKSQLPPVPDGLAPFALISAATAAAAADMSLSGFFAEVRDGRAPQPAIRGVRHTRWRMEDIKHWLIQRVDDHDPEKAAVVVGKAKHASAMAAVRRSTTAPASAPKSTAPPTGRAPRKCAGAEA
jgi:predicted DNA-binding transcriptional regulator AlpA